MSNVKEEAKDIESGQQSNALTGLTAQVMNNPEALAMMQSKLARMVGTLSGYYDTLPKVVKRRVKALKNIQVEYLKLEAKLHEEYHSIECKYSTLYEDLHKKRNDIVNSVYEPTDDECDFPSDEEENVASDETKKNAKESDENVSGIPAFWLTIFKNVEIISENIQEYDEPILGHLTDVNVKLNENPMGFTIEFHFSPNKYFTNKVLTKYYELKNTMDAKDPFAYEGPEIVKCKGCEINWNKGENVTVKTVHKKQKHKSKGSIRTVQKTVQADSFFNFFNPPAVPDNEDLDEDTEAILAADYEIGEIIRQRIVPRAVLYFTGEALVDEDYEDEDEEDEEEDESDEDEDEDYKEPEKGKKKGSKQSGQGNPQECKQQ